MCEKDNNKCSLYDASSVTPFNEDISTMSLVLTEIGMSYYKLSKNTYRFTLTASSYWNQYGLRVYLVVEGSSTSYHLVDTQVIYQAEYYRSDNYTYDLTITENCSIYGYIKCSYCEDHAHAGWPNGEEDPELWENWSSRSSFSYENPIPPPTAPTSVKLTGRYEQGVDPLCSWSGSTNATNHDIQRRYWDFINNSYSEWENVEWANSSSSRVLYNCNVNHNCVQARVRANGVNGTSSWTESNWIYHNGVRVWDGNNWVFAYFKVWNGTSWVGTDGVYGYVFDGTNFIVSK